MVLTLSITTVSCGKSSKTSSDDTIESIDDEKDLPEDEEEEPEEEKDDDDDGNKSGDNFGGTKTIIDTDDGNDDDSTTGKSDGGNNNGIEPDTDSNGNSGSNNEDVGETGPVPDGKKRISGSLNNSGDNVKVTINGNEQVLGPTGTDDDDFHIIVDEDEPIDLVVTAIDDNKICFIENPVHFENVTVDGLKIKCIDDITVGEVINLYDNAFINCLHSEYSPYLLSTKVSSVTRLHCHTGDDRLDSTEGLQHFVNVNEIDFGQSFKEPHASRDDSTGRYIAPDADIGIRELDLTNNVNLKKIRLEWFYGIKKLDFSTNILLEDFVSNWLLLEEIELSNLKNLKKFSAMASNFTNLDFSSNPNLDYLRFMYSHVSYPNKLVLAKPENLDTLVFYHTKLVDFNLDELINLTSLTLSHTDNVNWYNNGNKSQIDFSKNTKLNDVHLMGSLGMKYDFSQNTALTVLTLMNSGILSLNLYENVTLDTLYITPPFSSELPIIWPKTGKPPNIIE